jgi:putative transcriptional regulator
MLDRSVSAILAMLAAVCLGSGMRAQAAGPDDAIMLVAKPGLKGPLFGSSILLVKPIGGGRHIGFIVNKPTSATLGQLFPEHEPSKKVADPLYLGGPQELNKVFALVERHDGTHGDTVQMTQDLFLAVQVDAVDHIIEKEADHARFLVGLVSWAPGELDDELERGYWFKAEPDTKLLLRKKTEGLWDELRHREEDREHTI